MALDVELRPQDAETFRKLLLDACKSQVFIYVALFDVVCVTLLLSVHLHYFFW